jgi:hypothetical protein
MHQPNSDRSHNPHAGVLVTARKQIRQMDATPRRFSVAPPTSIAYVCFLQLLWFAGSCSARVQCPFKMTTMIIATITGGFECIVLGSIVFKWRKFCRIVAKAIVTLMITLINSRWEGVSDVDLNFHLV